MLIINIISSIFSTFIRLNFLNNTLKERNLRISPVIFYLFFIVAELSLNITTYIFTDYSSVLFSTVNVLICLISTFLLCFLYNSSIKAKILVSFLYQILVTFSDTLFTIIVSKCFPSLLANRTMGIIIVGGFCVNILLLLFSEIFISIWNRKLKKYNIQYNMLVLTTPICSYLIIHTLSFYSIDFPYIEDGLIYIIAILTLLNIINIVVLQLSFSSYETKNKNIILEREIAYQKEKYSQISSSYRNTRKILHDIKKHYFVIQELIKSEKYDELLNYTKNAINDLESNYAYFNSGNLVIDSLLTSYRLLYSRKNINFIAILHIDPSSVPIEDYDLCIILGNLLDNGLNALSKSGIQSAFFSIEIYSNENQKFIIHTKNPIHPSTSINTKENFKHGYGIDNICNTAKKYNGMIDISSSDYYETYIIIPIMNNIVSNPK